MVVPDHIGFGKSETPQDRVYTLKTHVENFTALVEALDLQNITLVIQDWGGPIGSQFAIRHPERVKRLFLANTIAGYGVDPAALAGPDWFQWIGGGLENGRAEAVLRELGSTVLSVMKLIGFTANVDRSWVRAYSARYAAQFNDIPTAGLMALLCATQMDWFDVAAYGAPFPDETYQAAVRRFPQLVPVEPGMEGVPYCERARKYWANEWHGESFMAIGMRDFVLGKDVMDELHTVIKGCPPALELEDVDHFVQEWGEEVAHAALRSFGITN